MKTETKAVISMLFLYGSVIVGAWLNNINIIYIMFAISVIIAFLPDKKDDNSYQAFLEEQKQKEIEAKIGVKENEPKKLNSEELLSLIREYYPDFNYDSFKSTIKVNLDKLTNKSIALDKTLEMIATENFIEKHLNDISYVKEIDADYVSRSGWLSVIDFDKNTKQILVDWTYGVNVYEFNKKTGKEMRGLRRKLYKSKKLWLIRADNVKYKNDIVHCPNCGAPLKYALDLKCNQCNSSFDYDNYWLLNDLEEGES
ncbi:MAG: hypothetical protein IKR04_05230 [Clostridia bacterium]|nr:hypothetical protein [Clostridia bacterium]